MADKKITQFTDGNTVQTTDEIAAVRSGDNVKVNVGSAATKEIGTGAGQVPTADYLGDLAFLDSVGAMQIDTDAVGNDELADNSVAAANLQTDSVTTIKILAKNVTYAKIQDISAQFRMLGRNSASAGIIEEVTFTQFLDWVGSAAQGDILIRGASAWTRLPAGTANYVLTTNGAAANPSYKDPNLLITIDNSIQDFRLSLTTGVPVTTADVIGATTIYAVPLKGNKIALYDSVATAWRQYTSAQFSLALGTLVSGKPYDVFAYQNAGVATLEFLVWTNDTARATALAYQDGVLVKSGDPTRRYLGSFYTTATTTTEDSRANRYLWNYYNRVSRGMSRIETTASWSYSTGSFRQTNASTLNQLNFIIGVSEDQVNIMAVSQALNNTGTLRAIMAGVGIDSTTASSAQMFYKGFCTSLAIAPSVALYNAPIAAGRHFAAWLEAGVGADSQTFLGASTQGGGINGGNGISGDLMG